MNPNPEPMLLQFGLIAGFALICVLLCLFSKSFALPAPVIESSNSGVATWYGEEHRGETMANGQPFDPDAATCATYAYPLGTWLVVQHGSKTTVVQVTDRGPDPKLRRLIDLSHAAFKRLADPKRGVIPVTVWRADAPISFTDGKVVSP